jgi:hypothetical protein
MRTDTTPRHRLRSLSIGLLLITTLAACGSDAGGASGVYTHPSEGSITLNDDGTFLITQGGVDGATGTYEVDGTTITFTIEDQSFSGPLEGDTLTDPDGNEFVKG